MVKTNKQNCCIIYARTFGRIIYFRKRMLEKGAPPQEVVIVAINVNDPHGQNIAEILMPNQNWDQLRQHFKIPFAGGITSRAVMQKELEKFDQEAAKKLQQSPNNAAVIVVDSGVAEVFFPDLGELPPVFN